MKEQIKSVLFNSILLLSRLICTISMKIKQRAIVLVPSWEGSLGDEAVIDSITCQLQSQGFFVTLLHFGKTKNGITYLILTNGSVFRLISVKVGGLHI